ncbi:MAG: hypothetical protein IT292_07925 [Deltaproteobacteria bacterium]|nr:hypothetical protein [Deltaproteobacteria bacterium]
MSLIHQINTAWIKSMLEAYPASGKGGSSISGVGAGASFDSDQLGVSNAMNYAADTFTSSYKRMAAGYAAISSTQYQLQEAQAYLEELSTLASQASDSQLSDNERVAIESSFRNLIRVYQRTMEKDVSEDSELDPKDLTDLQEILSDSGIDFGTSSAVTEAMGCIGGSDQYLGEERITTQDGTSLDISSLHVSTKDNAERALEYITALKKEISADSYGLDTIMGELGGASRFAVAGENAFRKAAEGLLANGSIDLLADALAADIRSNAADKALAAHSDLDSILAKTLLAVNQ